ncbi:hypothetical protein G1K66_12675 [Tenacibaculum finnmarkense]|uniref:hypothetical protein n=1 Tax=Tenacibaculum finnmarkense TaxID=2781243 RepID=UPI001E409F8B|nr:hypothetical protein [Tenacibaculum finnmarkense]MCD8401251.1 hypothetical protein [Tenacibaculum finnmarkense genomovar ulcerans]MCG8786453.1 hypothetical protein [Tenacibaculum finnmarkense]MCG8814111.1 hypothetical protein [Tenacibaculum finnmarkense]
MKKITLLLIGATFMISCGKNKEEQMLYDYQQKNVKALNFDLKDLDFKIKKIEKITDVTASDSLKILKKDLAKYWKKNTEESVIDTLSFKYVKNIINENISYQDTLYNSYQELVLSAIRRNDYLYKLKYKKQRNNAMKNRVSYQKTLGEVESIEKYYNQISEKPDSILSSKYKASYTHKNPMLGNTKQTFEKVFYTNSAQTKFIKEE